MAKDSITRNARRLQPFMASVGGDAAAVNANSIILYHGDAKQEFYPVTANGLTAALAATTSGDVVWVPAVTLAGDFTVPAGVLLEGIGGKTVLSGTVTLAGNNSGLYLLSVYSAGAGARVGVVGPATGTAQIRDCNLHAVSSDGAAYAVETQAGDLTIWYSSLIADSATSEGYSIYATGTGTTSLYWCKLEHDEIVKKIEYGSIIATVNLPSTRDWWTTISNSLTPGQRYCMESSGGPWCVDSYSGTTWVYHFGLSNGLQAVDFVTPSNYPAWADKAEAVDVNHTRVYFVAASGRTYYARCSDSTYYDNTGSLDIILRGTQENEVYVYACQGDTTGAISLEGDRAVYDAAAYPLLHANDTDVATSSLHHTLGTGANQASAGNHTHAQLHDPVTVADSATIDLSLTGQQVSGAVIPAGIKLDDLGAPDDNTDLDASTAKHGLLPKLGGGTTNFLRADGTWAAPGGSMENPMTTAGDLIVGGADGAPGRLAKGDDGQVLKMVSGSVAWGPDATSEGGSSTPGWGNLFDITAPVLTDFTWVNQGSATAIQSGGIFINAVDNNSQVTALVKAAPATPYTITGAFIGMMGANSNSEFGLVFRQSSDGKLHSWSVTNYSGGSLNNYKWDSPSSYSAAYTGLTGLAYIFFPVLFLRIADNGTNRIVSWSFDGVNYIQVHSVGRTDFLTADQVGIYLRKGAEDNKFTLLSWAEG